MIYMVGDEVASCSLQDLQNFADDLFVLSILPLLLPCKNLRVKRGKTESKTYKSSKVEQQNSFLLHVKVGDIFYFLFNKLSFLNAGSC